MKDTAYLRFISKNKEKQEIFINACNDGLIQEFEPSTITKLRDLYYSCLSGVLYLYGEETNEDTMGNKLLLLSHALEDEDFVLIHGLTDTSKEIDVSEYKGKKPTYNSWIEVKRSDRTWIYDTISMLMFDKSVYYQLENPQERRVFTKEELLNHPARKEDDLAFSDDWLLLELLPHFEQNAETSPYRNILKPEISRIKKMTDYDNLRLRIYKELFDYKEGQRR